MEAGPDPTLRHLFHMESIMRSFFPLTAVSKLKWVRGKAGETSGAVCPNNVIVEGIRFTSDRPIDTHTLEISTSGRTLWSLPLRVLYEIGTVCYDGTRVVVYFPRNFLFFDTQNQYLSTAGAKFPLVISAGNKRPDEIEILVRECFPVKEPTMAKYQRIRTLHTHTFTNAKVVDLQTCLVATGMFIITDKPVVSVKLLLDAEHALIDYDEHIMITACKQTCTAEVMFSHCLWVPFQPHAAWDDATDLTSIPSGRFESITAVIEPACSGAIHVVCANILTIQDDVAGLQFTQ